MRIFASLSLSSRCPVLPPYYLRTLRQCHVDCAQNCSSSYASSISAYWCATPTEPISWCEPPSNCTDDCSHECLDPTLLLATDPECEEYKYRKAADGSNMTIVSLPLSFNVSSAAICARNVTQLGTSTCPKEHTYHNITEHAPHLCHGELHTALLRAVRGFVLSALLRHFARGACQRHGHLPATLLRTLPRRERARPQCPGAERRGRRQSLGRRRAAQRHQLLWRRVLQRQRVRLPSGLRCGLRVAARRQLHEDVRRPRGSERLERLPLRMPGQRVGGLRARLPLRVYGQP